MKMFETYMQNLDSILFVSASRTLKGILAKIYTTTAREPSIYNSAKREAQILKAELCISNSNFIQSEL